MLRGFHNVEETPPGFKNPVPGVIAPKCVPPLVTGFFYCSRSSILINIKRFLSQKPTSHNGSHDNYRLYKY